MRSAVALQPQRTRKSILSDPKGRLVISTRSSADSVVRAKSAKREINKPSERCVAAVLVGRIDTRLYEGVDKKMNKCSLEVRRGLRFMARAVR